MWTLNTSTGKISQVGGLAFFPEDEGNAPFGRLALTADGTKLYFADAGQDGYVALPEGTLVYYGMAAYDSFGGYDVALSANQASAYVDGMTVDMNGNPEGLQALNYRESFDASYVYGAVISPDGTLLYQPGTQAIDVFDARTGAFQERVSISVTLTQNYRALVGDSNDNVLVAITGTGDGIAVVDLTALPSAQVLPYVKVLREEGLNRSVPKKQTNAMRPQSTATPRQFSRAHRLYRRGLVGRQNPGGNSAKAYASP